MVPIPIFSSRRHFDLRSHHDLSTLRKFSRMSKMAPPNHSRRFHVRHGLAAALFLGAVGLFAACDDDPPPYYYDGICEPGDPAGGRDCECIGSDCICPSSGDCAIYCVDNCSLQCAGSGSCDFLCDAACDVKCTGSGNCVSEVPHGSKVACTGSGDCDVLCHGDCSVACPGSGTCTVTCAPGAICDLEITNCEGVEECAGGSTLVCNGGCP
jgi:hypothetical protein